MVAVRVVQMALDAVIDVVAVRNRLMTATGAVDMARLVTAAAVIGRAAVGIFGGDPDHMLVDMVLMRMVQMTVVQVVDMVAVADGGVPAIGPVPVRVVGMLGFRASCHGTSSVW
jgi:hypothetical protein